MWIEISESKGIEKPYEVTSYAEVWIEIPGMVIGITRRKVTSYAEVWIEICHP